MFNLKDAENLWEWLKKDAKNERSNLTIRMEHPVSMRQTSRLTGLDNPFLDKVIKKTVVYGDAVVETRTYEQRVNTFLTKNNLEGAGEFEAGKAPGRSHRQDLPWFVTVSDKDPNQFYLNIEYDKDIKTVRFEVSYWLDGKQVDLRDFAEYLAPKFFDPKPEKFVNINTPKFQTIKYVKIAGLEFNY